jgi:hypothetical protein
VAPVRALLEADLHRRARRLAEAGPAGLFAELHPAVRWEGDRLEVEMAYDEDVDLGGRGLLLVPSAFMWERPAAITRPPWQPTLIYPARGAATLWEPRGGDAGGALGRLLGPTRARVLARLRRAPHHDRAGRAARAHDGRRLAAPGRPAGRRALHARRERRIVLYARTALGDALVGEGVDPGPARSCRG